jgi:hypothetical protein
MIYVTYDEAGNLTGAFVQDLQEQHAECFIEVSDEVRLAWTAYQANADRTGVELAPSTEPAPVVPAQVTMRQARLALLGAGMLSTVDQAVAGMTEAARIEWEYAATVERNSQLVAALAPLLGLTEAQLDDLFIQAATL